MTASQSPREPLALYQTWPLTEQARHFELGCVLSAVVTDLLPPQRTGELDVHHGGCWECDLTDNRLIWSGGVYDIFGLPRGASISRPEILGLYSEGSRAAMEGLRAYAIKHRRGFTLDAEVRAAVGETRWMRIIAAPVCEGTRVVSLSGLKLIV